MKKFLRSFVVGIILLGLIIPVFVQDSYAATTQAVDTTLNYGSEKEISNKELLIDQKTNLLLDKSGASLLEKDYGGLPYDLESVSITRHRTKLNFEYYVGDYNSSSYIGTDSGYADYDDYTFDYMLDISGINSKYALSLDSSYKMMAYPGTKLTYYVPTYDGQESEMTIKILIAPVKKYTLRVYSYQNRQDYENPNPTGKTQANIDGATEYWKVNTLSTSFDAVQGQVINLKSVSDLEDTRTASLPGGGSRTGTLASYGLYDNATNIYADKETVTIENTSPTSFSMAAFYNVDDFGSPVLKPSASSSFTSGAGVGFVGYNEGWKSPSTTETLSLNNPTQSEKLANYPFDFVGDGFDNPEYTLNPYWLEANWMLEHRISIDYNYVQAETSSINVYYNDEHGSTLDSMKLTGRVNAPYTTQAKDFEGYELITTPNNASGVFPTIANMGTDKDVVYTYKKIESDIPVNPPVTPSNEKPTVSTVDKPNVSKISPTDVNTIKTAGAIKSVRTDDTSSGILIIVLMGVVSLALVIISHKRRDS